EGPVIGCFVTFPSPGLTELTAHLGFEFTLLDSEHTAMDSVMIEDMIRASQCAGVPAIVRIPFNRPEYIRRALDSGANGVQVPMVSTAADARAALAPANFPPHGERGAAFLTRAARYGLEPDRATYFDRANEAKLVSLHIETPEAVRNLDEILEIGGADIYFVGPGDLAVSMGYGREPNHPEVTATIERCIRRIRETGKIAGTLVTDVARSKQVIEWGATYIVTAISPFIIQGATQYLQAVRQ
ncbi:MAG: aldolase/citrate lyase family protein, partial [Chloroflexota bacterium]|nr:aldolase/citrate lyase family protein [Chloroflexota bacterium]